MNNLDDSDRISPADKESFSGSNPLPSPMADPFQNQEDFVFYCSFMPLKRCSDCNKLTPYQFHYTCEHNSEMKWRKCAQHLGKAERLAVRVMYEIIYKSESEIQ